MHLQRTSIFIGALVIVAIISSAVGAFIADKSLDRYADTLADIASVRDVTRVKPSAVPTAVDDVIETVRATAAPSSYPLISLSDRVHADGVVPAATVGHATALTSDGWMLVPEILLNQYGSSLRFVVGGDVLAVETWVLDPATEMVFGKIDVEQVRVSTFADTVATRAGAPVFVVAGTHVYPRVVVESWHVDPAAIVSSDTYERRFLLDAPSDTAPGALVADANGSLLGVLDDSREVVPLHQLTSGLEQVLAEGRVVRPSLGVRVLDQSRVVTAEGKSGLRVVSVARRSVAETAGLLEDDVIVRVQGQSVHDQPLSEHVLGAAVGDTLLLTVEREGTEQEISVTL